MNARDRAYYLGRILQEQDAASTATCAEARARHEEFAAAYRLLCHVQAVIGDRLKVSSSQQVDFAV